MGLRRLRPWRGKLDRPTIEVNGRAGARAIVIALLSASVLASCASGARDVPHAGDNDVREFLRVASRAPALEETIDSAPEQIWKVAAGRGTLGPVALGERVIAVATVDRWLYLLDARTGRPFWRYRGDAPFATGPLIGYGRVFAATGSQEGRVVAVNLYSGRRRWGTRVGDVSAPLVLGDTTVYGTTQSGTVFALRSGNGKPRWMRQVAPIRSPPLLAGSRLAVVTLADSLLVFDALTGRPLTRAALPAGTASPLALVDDTTAALTSPTGGVILVTLTTGAVRWRRAVSAPIFGAPVVARDTVFALSNDCTLWAIPVANPAAADSAALGCVAVAPPVLARRGVLVATVGGDLLFFDRSARRRVWTRTVRGELRQPPSLRHGQIVVAPTVGDVVSFR